MPIIKSTEDETIQLHFGYADIKVAPGLLEGYSDISVVAFFDGEKEEIGKYTKYVPERYLEVKESPVRMVFEKPQSIDVVIRALEKAKQMMLLQTVEIE